MISLLVVVVVVAVLWVCNWLFDLSVLQPPEVSQRPILAL